MYAAVPRIIPASVISAGLVIVGDSASATSPGTALPCAFARPKSSTFTVAVGAQLDVRGLQIAMDDPLLVGGLKGLGDLPRDRQGVLERNRRDGDPVGKALRPRPAPSPAR